ncbi:MOSC domain-containing protein [Paenibacillus planticolens]|uniref:MOSC domain-containing protein n=1 Tax=Paenibacillus planticolens TaxID=2654976 RepID=A0ABX1ZIP6_9BACL|nr:MOSC domain-containing protein [Paenibacillus planticolens]NOU98847.1 MOSC domain-containing protein [Paenibacillus planticolens]
MTELIGEIKTIHRFPVKSFAGEDLKAVTIESYGLYGDRFCAFFDGTKKGWDSFFTARAIPKMLTYKATLVDDRINVLTPDGRTLGWNEELLAEIQTYSKKEISMASYKAPNPENPDLMSVDSASVLIITDGSLRKMEAIWGKQLDPLRFRANFIVALNDDNIHEKDWIGKRLTVGDAEFQVDSPCERCSLITIDPNTLERDVSLLKKVNEEADLKFGVYASVKRTGKIHVGDKVYLESR